MSYLEELLHEFRKGAKIRKKGWVTNNYIFLDNKRNEVRDQDKKYYSFTYVDFSTNDWELYQDPIDWDYIIKNKCLCWFWDEYENCRVKGTLAEVEKDNEYHFRIDLYNSHYRHCRPARRDEVTFYEDRKDE